MTSPAPRRFTVSDGMVLVAATAVGFGVARYSELRVNGNGITLSIMARVQVWLSFVGLFLTFALLTLRLWRPRPDLRDLFRQPGFAANFAVMVTIVVRLFVSWCVYRSMMPSVISRGSYVWDFFAVRFVAVTPVFDESIACPIVSVWLVMALGGRWDAEPGWVDRAGRALGVFWIGGALFFEVYWCLTR